MNNSIVKDSSKLREALKTRWKERKMTQQMVADDAAKYGQDRIIREALNKYINNPYAKGALNDRQIIWLAYRWLIPVTLQVGMPNKKNVKYITPKYSEKKALKLLNEIFPNEK